MVIFAEFGLYVFIRQVVRGLEWLFACGLILWLGIIATTNSVYFQGGDERDY